MSEIDKAISESIRSEASRRVAKTLSALRGCKIRFPDGNKIAYGCDFQFYRGIPHDIEWTIRETESPFKSDGFLELTAPGYGEKGDYGNGGICIDLRYREKDVPNE